MQKAPNVVLSAACVSLLLTCSCDSRGPVTGSQAAEDIKSQPLASITLPLRAYFKLQEVDDGKPAERWLDGSLSVSVDGLGRTNAVWEHVVINTSGKRIVLKPELFAEEWGRNIHAFEIQGSSASLVLNLAVDRPMKVMITKHQPTNGAPSSYEVRGTGLWWSDWLKRQIRVDWEPVFGPLLLPYREIE